MERIRIILKRKYFYNDYVLAHMKTLLILGFGHSAQALVPLLNRQEWRVIATSRNAEKAAWIEREFGVSSLPFFTLDGGGAPRKGRVGVNDSKPKIIAPSVSPMKNQFDSASLKGEQFLSSVTHILATAAPTENGDPFLPLIQRSDFPNLQWIGYLSTIGVYAESDGNWIDETAPIHADTPRIARRLQAEAGWRSILGDALILRLGGIYGPHANPLAAIRNGTAQRIIKPGHVFNRIHVNDIGGIVHAALTQNKTGIFNGVDDEPASSYDVQTYAASLLNLPPPPEVMFEQAQLSPMAQEFYSRCKRVRNERVKAELGYQFKYPSYREGLQACLNNQPA